MEAGRELCYFSTDADVGGTTVKRFRLQIPCVGSLTVTRTADVDSELRRVYSYVIRDNEGKVLKRGRDLRSGSSADFSSHPSPRAMTIALVAFLTEDPDLCGPRLAAWVRQSHDELSLTAAQLELEGEREV